MELKEIYKSNFVCLDFSEEENHDLLEYRFVPIKIRIDIRSNAYQNKLFNLLSEYLNDESIVCIVKPRLPYLTPAIISTILGITKNLPYLVYFKEQEYGDRKILVSNLEQIRWQAREATKLNTTPATLV